MLRSVRFFAPGLRSSNVAGHRAYGIIDVSESASAVWTHLVLRNGTRSPEFLAPTSHRPVLVEPCEGVGVPL